MQVPIHLKTGTGGRPVSAIAVFCKLLAPAVLTASLWSKLWLGGVAAGLLCLFALVLLVFGPRLLEGTGNRLNWARHVGFGEKIWLNRLFVPVPKDLNYRLTVLYLVFWTGVLVALWGGVATLPVLSISGLAVAYTAQIVCFGKLIHLYGLMKDKHPLYRFWAATAGNDNDSRAKQADPARRSA
ncbi:hypothetical protein CHH27_04310 [Labrenzia sp. VG12]|nr:hypothetical protein CHH27_04310 [Labrenzia sp. VG12]